MSAESSDSVPSFAEDKVLSHRRRVFLLITFVVAFATAAAMFTHVHRVHSEARRIETRMLAQGYAQRVQERLQTALVATHVLASMVRQSGGNLPNFNESATDLLALFPSVSALQLAPDGVIRDVYPLAGNEAALGHDLLADRQRNREAAAAITTRQLTLAGPFKLVQGGIGAVGRLPIFLSNERGDTYFWGFANALIRIPNLLEAAGLPSLASSGYRYELWRTHPDTDQREVFARSGEEPPHDPVEYTTTVSNGRWVLSIAPEGGWITASDYTAIVSLSLGTAVLVTLLQWAAFGALLRRPATSAPSSAPHP